MDWQPIESHDSSPESGERVLLSDPKWYQGEAFIGWKLSAGGFMAEGHKMTYLPEPTHWRPLPSPPKE